MGLLVPVLGQEMGFTGPTWDGPAVPTSKADASWRRSQVRPPQAPWPLASLSLLVTTKTETIPIQAMIAVKPPPLDVQATLDPTAVRTK